MYASKQFYSYFHDINLLFIRYCGYGNYHIYKREPGKHTSSRISDKEFPFKAQCIFSTFSKSRLFEIVYTQSPNNLKCEPILKQENMYKCKHLKSVLHTIYIQNLQHLLTSYFIYHEN